MNKLKTLFSLFIITILVSESIYVLLTYSNLIDLGVKADINLQIQKPKFKDSNMELKGHLETYVINRPKNRTSSCGIYTFSQNPLYVEQDVINVFFYLDENFPSTIELDAWTRLRSYLRYWLPSESLNFYEVNASELAEVMKDYRKGIVIIPNGIFPYTIYNGSSFPDNLFNKWVMHGGIAILAGDGIGGWIGYEDKTKREVFMAQSKVFGQSIGILKYLPYSYKNYPFIAYEENNITSILNLQYKNTPYSPLLKYIKYYGGLEIGYTTRIKEDILTSCSLIRVGNGTIILFSGNFNTGEYQTIDRSSAFDIASDIKAIIDSGLIFIQRPSLIEYGETISIIPKTPEITTFGGVTDYSIQYEKGSGAILMNMSCSYLGQIGITIPKRKSYAITIFEYPKVPSGVGLQIKYKKDNNLDTFHLAIDPAHFANETLYVLSDTPNDIRLKIPPYYVYILNMSDMMQFIDFNYTDIEEILFRLASDKEFSNIKFGIYDVNKIKKLEYIGFSSQIFQPFKERFYVNTSLNVDYFQNKCFIIGGYYSLENKLFEYHIFTKTIKIHLR